jgi:hypothetical protein
MLAARAKAMSEKGGAAAAVSALTTKAKLAIGAWLCPSVQQSRQHSDESRYDSSAGSSRRSADYCFSA